MPYDASKTTWQRDCLGGALIAFIIALMIALSAVSDDPLAWLRQVFMVGP